MEKLYKYPALIVCIISALTVFFISQLPRLRLDNNNMRFLPKENQARTTSEYIDKEFGGQVVIFVGLERPYGTVFDPEFLDKLKSFADAAKLVDLVKDVNSLMSTKFITGDSESIIVTDLVPDDFSGVAAEIAELKRRIASWDLFEGAIVSNDQQATQVLITLDVTTEEQTSPEVNDVIKKIRELAEEAFAGIANVYITGMPVISATINEALIADNMILIPLAFVVMLAVMFFSFRRFTFVMLPTLTVIVVVIWTAGIMGLLAIKLSIITTILPVILLAVGNSYSIHVVIHYMEEFKGKTLTVESHRALVFDVMRKMIKPVFLTAITTFAGFISFCFTPIVPMREFGAFAGIGVIVSFIITITLIPALLLIRGPNAFKTVSHSKDAQANSFENMIGDFFLSIANKKISILFISVLVISLSVYGISKIIVDNVLIEFFRNETEISRSDRFINEHFGGSKELTLVIKAETSEELLSPVLLSAVDNLSSYLSDRVPEIGKVIGFTDIIKRINQVFNVDESPEGLAASRDSGGSIADDSFGFGFYNIDDFGFGFGDEQFVEVAYTPFTQHNETREYSVSELIAFFDTAAANKADMSGNDLVQELKRLINYDGFSYYEIPSNPARYGKKTDKELQRLVSNYLVLLSGDDLLVYSNDPLEPTAIKMSIQLCSTGNYDTLAVIEKIKAFFDANFPDNAELMIGGGATVEAAITELIVSSQIISIAVSVLVVFIIIALSYKSFVAGFVGAVPLAIAIVCNFAVMGFLGIKLNIGTALIASLALSIGIDYTIHFIESFRREYASGNDGFLRRTFINCGKAIIVDSVSVGAGFAVLALSRFRIVAQMGSLVAFSMMISALVSLTLIPALLTVIKPKFVYGGKK